MMNQKILGMALIVGLAVSGCGGNGGGSMGGDPGGNGGGNVGDTLQSVNVPTGVTGSGSVGVAAVASAAQSTPRAGSVTQSSNAGQDGVTIDRMNVDAGYAGGTVTFTGMFDRGDGSPDVTIGTGDADFVLTEYGEGNKVESYEDICSRCGNSAEFSGEKWTGAFLGKRIAGDDVLLTAFFTDLQSGDAAGTDYLAAGVWLLAPEAVVVGGDSPQSGDIEFGAFSDPSNPFPQAGIMALTGSARYQGDALGIYATEDSSSGGTVGAGLLFADVELTANFGNADGLGTVGGTVTNFMLRDLDADSLDDTYSNLVLTLAQTDIGDMEGGFFTGATSGTDHNGATYTGQWGGMFAGDGAAGANPTSVGGTFGAATTGGSVDVNFVGSFGAYEQP